MKDFRSWAIAGLVAFASSTSAEAASVTYLECRMTTGGGGPEMIWQISLDEGVRTVTYKHSEAEGVRPGVFTPSMVSWNDGRFSISRIDLTFSRTALGATDKGKCKFVSPPKRAF